MDRGYLEESSAGKILAIVTTFLVLALITVLIHLYTRLSVIRNASRDDLCITLEVVGFSFTPVGKSQTLLQVCSLWVSITIFYGKSEQNLDEYLC
jgi:hypothetical protein